MKFKFSGSFGVFKSVSCPTGALRKMEIYLPLVALFVCAPLLQADIFGKVQGIVHDPQHRPVPGASVNIEATTSSWAQSTQTNDNGEFVFATVPVGDYKITVRGTSFVTAAQSATVTSNASLILHFQLSIAALNETAVVVAQAAALPMETVTPTSLVSREDIAQTPGADRTNSLAMIADYTPGAYITHDMLHMRGGHQTDWLIDGVPIPNTNIGANIAPVIDPKDIDYMEVQRGSYDAQYGDRTYGVFNIVPRTGFERNSEAELVVSAGNWDQTNDQFNFGGHTMRFAYYASVSGNRSDYGLQTPVTQVVHDAENGYGGFGSFIYNLNPSNQLRLVASLRQDYYQLPIDPNPGSDANQLYPTYGLRDSEREPDGYVAFSWVRTFSPNLRLTVSPFYHANQAQYNASPNDLPVASAVRQSAQYGGAQASVNATLSKDHEVDAGFYGFFQHQSNSFSNAFTDCSPDCPSPGVSSAAVTGGLAELFLSDRYKVTSWLTLIAGLRYSHFDSGSFAGGTVPALIEDVADPRLGIALRIPRVNIVFHGFWGRFYQPPPLLTATGPLLDLATSQALTFGPLAGERDHEYQFGVSIPFHGWVLEEDTFRTSASNWLDHSNIGESNIFWPVTWASALIRGWETTLRSPRIWRKAQIHVAYSNQIAEASSPFTGGLICPLPVLEACQPDPGLSPVDHDQRNTFNAGINMLLPHGFLASANFYYGSGFTNGNPNDQYPGDYLPSHTQVDVSVGKSFGQEGKYRVSITALNLANNRVLLDNSPTFGGFHFNDPRQIYGEFRWRFHY